MTACGLATMITAYFKYFGSGGNSLTSVIPLFNALALLIFLIIRAPGYKGILTGMAAVCTVAVLVSSISHGALPNFSPVQSLGNWLLLQPPYWCIMFSLVFILVQSWRKWRTESWFFRVFAPAATLFAAANWGLSALLKEEGNFFRQLLLSLASGQMDFLFSCTVPPVLLAAIVTALAEAARNEIEHREERHLMALKSELALAGFENLSRQHEEVMMLRHDMMRHLRTIQEMSDRAQIQNYLAELIGQNEKIRPVVQSGHEMLDILLNGKLAMAASMGIRTRIQQIRVPQSLPLSDADLCSLITNLMDNALEAASMARAPFLNLDIHAKDGYLVLVCENSCDPARPARTKKETVPKHGLGLKIIRSIVQRYEGVVQAETENDLYKTRIVIPLS